MSEHIRYRRATSNGAGRYYVEAQYVEGGDAASWIVITRATGEGDSAVSAKKDATIQLGKAYADYMFRTQSNEF